MKHELETKLQAWVDGQLPVHEADEVARLIENDAEVCALMTELKNTRAAFAGHEDSVRVPESREFYWSKIKRSIEREEKKEAFAAPEASWFFHWKRVLLPAGAAIALVIIGMLAKPGAVAGFELSGLETDSDTFTFTDEETGTTLVWFSYSENDLAETRESNNL
jgi:anti-sigma factor RsiW